MVKNMTKMYSYKGICAHCISMSDAYIAWEFVLACLLIMDSLSHESYSIRCRENFLIDFDALNVSFYKGIVDEKHRIFTIRDQTLSV